VAVQLMCVYDLHKHTRDDKQININNNNNNNNEYSRFLISAGF
jgi:hypothetical protein